MLNMSDIDLIREMKKNGKTITEIHKETGHDPKTIRKCLKVEDFSPVAPVKESKPSILDPYKEQITQWLKDDTAHWYKQRHTAKKIYSRLKEEYGYTGSYETVQRYVKDNRIKVNTKASLELVWNPGTAEVDFGEADFVEKGRNVRKKYLVVSFPYSNDGYAQLFDGETAECVCQGLQNIFNYIGGVPSRLIFDNATGIGRRVQDKVSMTELFKRFKMHYGFEARFCNPYAGYEKGNVESKVGEIRRDLFVPVPEIDDVMQYNAELLDKHKIKASEYHYKKHIKISDLFEEDKKAFLPLPIHPFNVCRYETFKADGYGNVCIDGKHHYSTRPENHNQDILVGIRADYIDILNPDGSLLVRHRRKYGDKRTDTIDYSTTVSMLSRNSGAWWNSGIRQESPEIFRDYLDKLSHEERRKKLYLLNNLNDKYGYETAVKAMCTAIENGSVNKADTNILAARIAGYGINTAPTPGPSLAAYDEAFLKEASHD